MRLVAGGKPLMWPLRYPCSTLIFVANTQPAAFTVLLGKLFVRRIAIDCQQASCGVRRALDLYVSFPIRAQTAWRMIVIGMPTIARLCTGSSDCLLS